MWKISKFYKIQSLKTGQKFYQKYETHHAFGFPAFLYLLLAFSFPPFFANFSLPKAVFPNGVVYFIFLWITHFNSLWSIYLFHGETPSLDSKASVLPKHVSLGIAYFLLPIKTLWSFVFVLKAASKSYSPHY